ncbi:MAG: hypothetical protein R3F60_09020 [bacterium]
MTEPGPHPGSLRVQKAAPKKGGRRRRGEPEVVVDAAFLGAIPLFAGLEPGLLHGLASRVEHVELARGDVLHEGPVLSDDAAPVFVMLFGDVGVHRAGHEGRETTVNYLTVGEVFVQKLFVKEHTRTLRLVALCPARALKLRYRDLNFLMSQAPALRDRVSAAVQGVSQRQADYFDADFRKEIAAFFVAERLTFAGRVKIKRMDICIECDACYDACRDRHGTDRLGASEVKYGITEIPQNCHNCVVPECMDKCKFGHISRDPTTQEIVIADDCTGCTLCAKGCSFGAIRMHALADLNVSKYFPDRSPDAKGLNIAQKCDNCTGYADKACITACPTGAMFQVDGVDLFRHWEQFTVHERPGFHGITSPENRPSLMARWFWGLFALVNTLIVAWECIGRLYWPGWTFGQAFYTWGLTETGLDPLDPFRAGDLFGHSLGWIGAGCCFATQLYRLGKKWAPRFGSVQAWMEFHVWIGILAGVYGFFHTAFVLQKPVAIAAFATMMIAVITGIVGRYVVFLVPRSGAGQQLALADTVARIKALNAEIQGRFRDQSVGQTMLIRLDALTQQSVAEAAATMPTRADDPAEKGRLLSGIWRLVGEDRRERRAIDRMGSELAQKVEGRADEVVALMKEKARLERSTRRHAFLARILKRYRVVHVVSSNIMFGALVAHIVISLSYTVGM